MHADNTAARRCYEKAGFVTEGIKRHAYYNNGQFRDVVIMGMLHEEYATQQ